MAEPFLGQINIFGFNFPPRGWAKCDGQTLPISQNSALFSLLGTIYGGDGRTNFKLPDLRGRIAMHHGTGPGLPEVPIGQSAGSNNAQLSVNELPPHGHSLQLDCNQTAGDSDNPQGRVPAVSNEDVYAAASDAQMAVMRTLDTGNGQAFSIRNPYLGVNFCIALTGVFPSRS